MQKQSFFIKSPSIQLATALLLAIALPMSPAIATHRNEYQACANQLLRAGLSPAQIADACATALHPQELSECTLRIQQRTSISATDALSGCVRVRRPLELATCVVDINRNTKEVQAISVLDYCRRSLLPIRFGECVVGLSRRIDISPARAMNTCISPGYEQSSKFIFEPKPLQFQSTLIAASAIVNPGSF